MLLGFLSKHDATRARIRILTVTELYRKISSVAHQWTELRAQRSWLTRFFNRDDISPDVAKLNDDIRAACATFVVGSNITDEYEQYSIVS